MPLILGKPWTFADRDKLRVLWATQASAAEIGEMLGGRTKNSILGEAHRMKLPLRATPANLAKEAKKSSAPVVRIAGDGLTLPLPPSVAHMDPKQFGPALPSVPRSCTWLVSHDRPWRACEAVLAPGKPYCVAHAAIAYVVLEKRA